MCMCACVYVHTCIHIFILLVFWTGTRTHGHAHARPMRITKTELFNINKLHTHAHTHMHISRTHTHIRTYKFTYANLNSCNVTVVYSCYFSVNGNFIHTHTPSIKKHSLLAKWVHNFSQQTKLAHVQRKPHPSCILLTFYSFNFCQARPLNATWSHSSFAFSLEMIFIWFVFNSQFSFDFFYY